LLAAVSVLALAACGGPPVPIEEAFEVTDLTTGWYDAGVQNGLNKLVPTVGFRLTNVTEGPVRNVQLNAVFRQIGDEEEWGASYQRVVSGEELPAGEATPDVELRSNLGYTSTEPRAVMLDHSQFVDVRVEVFAKYGSLQWAPIGDWEIERTMLAR
jgi:hypothetical protein